MTNQYMNNLYRDLLSNSPQTITIDIPADMGTGQISQIVTKQGAVVSDWRMNYFSDMNVQGVSSEEYIQMLFCFNDGVSWNIADNRQSASIQKGESCIYRGHGKMEYLCYSKKSDFLFKNVKIPLSYFYKILNDYFEAGEIDVYQKKLLDGISKVNITPYMEHIFAELKDFTQYRGGLGYLFLESKVFELLSVYLSEVLELSILASTYVAISRSDRDSIIEAKRIIDSQLALAPSCEELARQVNISTSKLTKGFSSLFGTSVHAYIIDQRLEKAASLLLESNLNVSQVAILAMLGFIPIFIPLMAVLCPLIGGIPYMLYVTKAKKFGMTAIMGFLIGLIMVFFGNGYLTMVTGLVGGLLADVILKKADYKSAKSTVLSCGVFSIWVFGNFAPIFLNRESYLVMLTEGYGAEYAATLNTYMPMWIAPILLVACFVFGIVGGLIGKAICKKHFQRAGIA